jgi:hypothetical protein
MDRSTHERAGRPAARAKRPRQADQSPERASRRRRRGRVRLLPARWLRVSGAGLVVLAAACSDGPSSPVERAAVVEAAATDGQTASVGAMVATPPAVIVRDRTGQPVSGTHVQFAVTRGGGTLATTSVRTGADGIASSGRWTLGEAGVNEVTATVGTLAPVRFTATAVLAGTDGQPGAVGAYRIDVRYVGSATARQQQAVTAAIARWRTVIVDKLPAIPVNSAAGSCFDAQPAVRETVDDMLIFVEFSPIDGPGKVLGEAGPCLVRSESYLPVMGYLRLDTADLEQMERAGTLDDVVLHEIGHILGIGTLWDHKKLITGSGGDDPVFTGQQALQSYFTLGVTSAPGVPVENTGGAGTREGHWRESVFGNELMTGYISGTPNPLSALTVGSLKDLGYGTSFAGATTYALGTTARGVSEPLDLRGREIVRGPKYKIDRNGTQTRIEPPGPGPLR